MKRQLSARAITAWSLAATAGFAVSARGGLQPEPAPDASSDLAPGAGDIGDAIEPRIRFNFIELPFGEVMNFMARESGLPVIREAPLPPGAMTFISAADYTLEEAIEILNLNLRMHGARLERGEKYLTLRSIEDAARRPTPVLSDEDLEGIDPSKFLTIYLPLNNAIASQVSEQIAPLIKAPGMVQAIDAQNMLIIVETAAQCRRLREIVNQIDSVRPADIGLRVFPVTNTSAAGLAESLRALVPERDQVMTIDKNGQPKIVEDVSKPPLKIQADERLNAVIAVGPSQRMGTIEELIALLDTPETGAPSGRRMMTFTLADADATAAAAQLESLFRALPERRRPTVQALADVGKVVVVASADLLAQSKALLEELDPGLGDGQGAGVRSARVIPLEHVTSQQAEQIVRRLLSPRQSKVIRFAPLPGGSGLVVAGPSGDVEQFEKLVRGLDVQPDRRHEARVVRITEGDPAQIVEMARGVEALTGDEARDPVRTIIDADSRSVTLVGTREGVTRFEQRLRAAQSQAGVELETRTYRLDSVNATQLSGRLSRLARPLLTPTDGSAYRAPSFEALDELETLVVRALPGQFSTIEGLIDQLDGERGSDRRLQVLDLVGSDPEGTLARALALYEEQTRGLPVSEAGTIDAEIDKVAGKLIVRANAAGMTRFTGLLRQVQQLMPPARTTRIIDIQQVKAADLIEPLQEFLASGDPVDPGRETPEPTLRVIERTNSIVVKAEELQHRVIADYVRRLDKIEPSELPPLRLLQLRTADALGIASMLQQQYNKRPSADRLARPVEVRADGTTNTLIVAAHEELLGEIRAFVDELNTDADEPERITFLFPLKVARAVDVAKAMDKLYPQPPMPRDRYNRPMPWLQEQKEVTVSADASSNSLIIDAIADRRESLEELAEKLDRVEVPPVAELRTYRVVEADLNAVARMLSGLARQGTLAGPAQAGKAKVQVVIETEPASSTLIVAGDEVTFAKVEQVLASLEAAPIERGLRIVPIANAQATVIRDRAMAIYESQVAQIPSAGSVNVSVNDETNTLEVVADEKAMNRFLGILDELQDQIGAAREVRLIELRLAAVGEVIGFLEELVEASDSLRIGGGPRPVFEPIETTNSIMVAAQPEQFAIIEQLVRSLDAQQTGDRPPLRILRLRSTEAGNLAQVLNRSYQQRPVDERTLKPVNIQADPATNTLIVSAHPDVLPEIERIISELNDAQSFDSAARQIRIFPLRVARAEELAKTIDEMYPEPPMPRDSRGRPRPDLQLPKEIFVRADRATNSLIVDAPTDRLAGFEQIVEQLDKASLSADVELRTYRVARADLAAVERTIRDLADRGALATTGQAPVTVSTEPASRTLIVSGPSAVFERIESVLAEVDAGANRPVTGLKMYALEHTRAERLAPLLEGLLETRLREQQLSGEGVIAGETETLLDIVSDGASNTLIISAPESILDIAEQLIEALDTEAASIGRSVIRVAPLTYAEARSVAQTINEALPTIELPSGGPVRVIAAAGSNALLLSGSEKDLEKIEALIDSLDRQPFDPEKPAVETFMLQHADARAIAATVERLLVDQQQTDPRILALQLRYTRGRVPLQPKIRVEAEQRTNSLIVSGPGSTIELARALIARLDQQGEEPGRTVVTFTPAKGDPARLAQTVREIVKATMAQGRRPLELTPEPSTGSVIVIGTDEQVARAVGLLQEHDDRTVGMPLVEIRSFDLAHADADAVAKTVQSLLSDRSRWPEGLLRAERAGVSLPRPALEADRGSSRVIVSAPAALMAMAEQLITTLDRPSASGGVEIRVFTLSEGDAGSVAKALEQALSMGVSPAEPRPSVSAEVRSNSVVVAGSRQRVEMAAGLIASMDSVAMETSEIGVRTIFLEHARAEALAPIVESVLTQDSVLSMAPEWGRWQLANTMINRGQAPDFNGIRVAPERRLNALVVSAPLAMLELAEQVISGLDVDPGDGPGGGRVVRVITLTNADAQELAGNIEAVFDEDATGAAAPTVRVDTSSNSLIVRATSGQFETIESLAQTLDAATLTTRSQIRMIPLDRSRVSAAEMAQTLKRLLEQRGGVRVDVISAEELLEGGEDEPGASAPVDQLPLLTPAWVTLFQHAMGLLALEPIEVEPSESATVTIAVDPVSNTLMVVGSPRITDRIAALAAELAMQMPVEPTGVRIVELPASLDPARVAQVVNQTVRQVGRSGATNPGGFTGRVSVSPDTQGQALIVWANETDFASVRDLVSGLARLNRSDELAVKVYPLRNVSARSAASSVRDLVSPRPRGRQARRVRTLDLSVQGSDGQVVRRTIDPARVSVTMDPGQGSLIVTAPSDALQLIDRFVELIDQSPAGERLAIRQYTLEYARASALSRTLQALFDAQRQGAGANERTRARFVADDRTNALLVTASGEQHAEIERLLAAADISLEDDELELAIIPLQLARPSAVQQIIEQVVIGRDPAMREKVLISAQDNSGVFVVRAPKEKIAQIREIVAQVDTSEAAAYPVRSIKLERADALSVAASLQEFFQNRARVGQARSNGRGGGDAAIVGDRRSGTLVIAASDEDFEQISELAAQFDAPAAGKEIQYKIIELQHARATDIRDSIENIVYDLQWERSSRFRGNADTGSQDRVLIEVNERTNTVLVFGQGETLEVLTKIIADLDRAPGEQGKRVVRALTAEGADLDALARLIEEVTASPGWRWWMGTDPEQVSVEVDRDRRLLILIGVKARVDEAAAYVEEIAAAGGDDGRSIVPIRLEHARADRAASSLQRFFRDRARAEGRRADSVAIIGSREGNLIIVSADEEDLAIVRELIEQIDLPDLAADREIRVFALSNAEPSETARTINQMISRTGRDEDRVIISAQETMRSLIVSAPGERMEEIESLIGRLDALPGAEHAQIETVTLEVARASAVARELEMALPESVRVEITPVARTNSIMLTGSREAIALARAQIEALDIEAPRAPVEFRRYEVQHTTASDIAYSLSALLRNRPRGEGEPVPVVDANFNDDVLSVTAGADEMRFIESLVEQLDVPQQTARTTEFIKLEFAGAAQAADALKVFYGPGSFEARTPAERNVTIVADPASNSLVVSADESVWSGLRGLLEKLDTPEYDTTQQLVVIPLTHASATSVARALNEGLRAPLENQLERERVRLEAERRGQNGRDGRDGAVAPAVLIDAEGVPTVSAERETNSLIVFAGRKDLERIREIVAQLDVPDILKLPEARLIALRSGRASVLAEAVRRVFLAQDDPDNPRRVMVYGDDSSNVIIVRAEDAEFEQISRLAEQLQSQAATAESTPRVMRLSHVPAARVRETVMRTFAPIAAQRGETFAVEIDRGSNSLVIAASETLHEQIKSIVEELDRASAPEDGGDSAGIGQNVSIIEVVNNAPDEIVASLVALGVTQAQPADRPVLVSEPVRLVALTTRRAISVLANPSDGRAIERLIRELDASPIRPDEQLKVVKLYVAEAQGVARLLGQMLTLDPSGERSGAASGLVEQVRRLNLMRTGIDDGPVRLDLSRPIRLIADPQTNSIIIGSSAANAIAVAELIATFDTLPIGEAVTVRVFPLRNASATRLQTIIEDLFRRGEEIRRIPGTQRQGQPTTTVGRALAGSIAVTVDERTNALVIAGREEALALVEVLLKDLDNGDSERGWIETELTVLEYADAVSMADKLRRVLIDGLGETPDAIGLRTQVGRLRVALREGGEAVVSDRYAVMSGLVIEPEESLNALILVGSRANIDAVRELVKILDVEQASAANTVRVIPLKHASAERAAGIIEDVFSKREGQRSSRPEDRVIVSIDNRTNALIVSTSPRSFALLEGLIRTIDTEEARFAVGLHVIPAPNADVNRLAPKIQRLMRERINASQVRGGRQSALDVFQIEAEPATSSLIVACSDENLELVYELIEALTTGEVEAAGADRTALIQVESPGQAGVIAQAVRELYVDRENTRRGERSVSVTSNERLNALIVSGTERDIEAIRELVTQLDEAPVDLVQEIRRVRLESAGAREMVRLIESVLAGRAMGGGRIGPSATRVQMLGEQLAEIAAEATMDGTLRDHVTLTPDPRTNSVLIKAPPEMMNLIATMIEDLDGEKRGDRVIEQFRLVNADADQMQSLLVQLFNLRQDGDRYVLAPAGDEMADEFASGTFTPIADGRQELSITVDRRTNTLLVSGTSEYIEEVRKIVIELDGIEATERERLVYHLHNAKAKDIEETLQSYFSGERELRRSTLGPQFTGSLMRELEQEVTVVGDEKSNKLVISASPRYIDTVAQIVEELDAAPPQVMIQVLLAEVTIDDSSEFGIDVSIGGVLSEGEGVADLVNRSKIGGDGFAFQKLAAGAGIATALGVPNFAIASTDFGLLIRALQEQGKLEVLSRPMVQVNNNERAFIQVGENIGITDGIERRDTGGTSAVIRREDVGIILEVTPSISADGFVRMDITPEISTLSDRTTQIDENFAAPIITQRRVQTTVTVKDGQTVVIGGLMQTTDQLRKTKVPLLGDIPVLGELFKSEKQSSVKTELLIILTPYVIPGDASGRERQERLTRHAINLLEDPTKIREVLKQEHTIDLDPVPGSSLDTAIKRIDGLHHSDIKDGDGESSIGKGDGQ